MYIVYNKDASGLKLYLMIMNLLQSGSEVRLFKFKIFCTIAVVWLVAQLKIFLATCETFYRLIKQKIQNSPQLKRNNDKYVTLHVSIDSYPLCNL